VASGIYQIENQVNGKRYIGSAVDLRKRRQNHFSALHCGGHENQHLQRAFNKYGGDTFVFEVLEETEPKKLIIREQYYIDLLLPEYNISSIAGSPLGIRHTDEARANMSAARKGKHHSEATRRKISEANKGRPVSAETRKKISGTQRGSRGHNYGKHLSEDARRKISNAQKTRWCKIRAIESADT